MQVMKLKYVFMLLLMSAFLFPNNTFAQDNKVKKKVVIIKKTIDKDGNEKVEKIIKEGEDIDIDALIKSAESEEGNVEIDVEVTTEGGESKREGDKEKKVTVTVEGNQVKIKSGDDVEIIQIEEEDGTQEIKTPDGKHIIIKRSSAEGEDLDVGEMLEEVNIEVTEDGEKQIRIIKMGGPEPNENDAFFGVMIDPSTGGMELLNVVEGSPAQKAGLQRGDILRNIDGTKINSYKELTDFLSQKKPSDSIVVVYDRNQTSNKARVVLDRRGDVKSSKKMIWKTEDGKEIEIDEDHDSHFHGKIKKEKIIIKKKIKKEKQKQN